MIMIMMRDAAIINNNNLLGRRPESASSVPNLNTDSSKV